MNASSASMTKLDGKWSGLYTIAKILFLVDLLLLTNYSFVARLIMLANRHQWSALFPFLAIWLVSIVAVCVIALHPKFWVRSVWGVIVAASTAIGWGYHNASQSQINVFDMLSLWNARHEAGRAADLYHSSMVLAAILFAASFLVFVAPARQWRDRARKWLIPAAALPAIPVFLIAGVVWLKNGGGSQSLPSQFTPVSLASLASVKIAIDKPAVRGSVAFQPARPANANSIVYLVDESIRADYLDFTPRNKYTPHLAELAGKFTNFGPAASGGNCSNYSNSILRYGASRKDLITSATTNPTLFQYAKKAGFRTVFIDAQAGNITDGSMLQNFMTMEEKSDIDGFYALHDVGSTLADVELASIVAKELKSGIPVFIYANKNGSHFPYDSAYPASETIFHPSIAEAGADTQASRVASYRNAIAWSVDKFMQKFFATADLSHTTLIYTSDHGQSVNPTMLTHCQVDGADPRQGLVPLLAYSSDPAVVAKFQTGANLLRGLSSHFQIAPTLYELMGYARSDIATLYDESLFEKTARAPAFTSGDVFGMFSSAVHWNPVDLSVQYLEPAGGTVSARTFESTKEKG
jgi:glucan phosphoethanolaminetransferase (alkaline phosphatase superfamily)